jgi:Acetyltransferase (GNAT) domain
MRVTAAEPGVSAHAGTPLAVREESFEFRTVAEPQGSGPLTNEVTDFLDTQDTAHPFQLPAWSDSAGSFFLLERHGRIQSFAKTGFFYPVGQIVRPLRVLTLNRGPVCDDLKAIKIGFTELIQTASRMGMTYIDVLPDWTGELADSAVAFLAQTGWLPLSGGRATLRLDLAPSLDFLIRSFRSTTRYEIRRSEAAGLAVTPSCNEREFQEFLHLYGSMAQEKRFTVEKPDLLLRVFRSLAADPTRGTLLLARQGNELRGGIVIVRIGSRCWYVLGATTKDRKVSAGHLLQWHGIQWAKQIGCREYDFGGYREGSESGPGLFKRGFCDRIVRFPPAHRYVLSPARYRLLLALNRARHLLHSD